MSKNNGGSAFPATEANYHNENMRGDGMSLRDYFAAGFAATQVTTTSADTSLVNPQYLDPRSNGLTVAQVIAKNSYALADAMLAERDK